MLAGCDDIAALVFGIKYNYGFSLPELAHDMCDLIIQGISV